MVAARHRPRRPFRGWVWAPILLVVLVAACQGPFPQSTFATTSRSAQDMRDLFMLIFGLAVVVFVLVEGALLFTVIRFRARPGAPDPKPVHGHTPLEIGWTLAPAFIVSLIAVPTVSAIWRSALNEPENPLRIEVVGHQWWWEFTYPESGVRTANEMHVPQGRPVVLEMTSADVIHSFWLPGLAAKRDAILGRTTRLEFTADSLGEFMGQCAEYCGTSHANMRVRVVVDAPDAFDGWTAAQLAGPVSPDSLSGLAREGLEVFRTPKTPATHSCIACHSVSGVSFGVAGPNLTHVGSRTRIAGGVLENSTENLTRWLANPSAVKPGMGSQMQSGQLIGMPDVDLTPEEIRALVAYLESLR